MKKIIALLLTTAALQAQTLQEQAKEAGLKAIPSKTEAIMKLIDNKNNPLTQEKVILGYKLYMDPRLSKSGFISCNSCHNLGLGGVDGVAAAIGHKWAINPHHLNSPTVYNAVFADSQFWDGRDPNLEKQAQGPIQAPPEMAASKKHVVAVVDSIPEYKNALKKIYKRVNFRYVTEAIAAFERTLITPAPYDLFLEGNDKALTEKAQKGLKIFMDKGCVTCHSGYALGGTMQGFALTAPYKYENVGDFKGDKNGMVKVPTLRNITQTAPYFHNGAVKTMQEAIAEMGRIQLGMDLSKEEIGDIVEFFKALQGQKPALPVIELPASTATTPQPQY
jgi:cytochrome c peroxidase